MRQTPMRSDSYRAVLSRRDKRQEACFTWAMLLGMVWGVPGLVQRPTAAHLPRTRLKVCFSYGEVGECRESSRFHVQAPSRRAPVLVCWVSAVLQWPPHPSLRDSRGAPVGASLGRGWCDRAPCRGGAPHIRLIGPWGKGLGPARGLWHPAQRCGSRPRQRLPSKPWSLKAMAR